jgi:hypothetical protein
VQTKTIPHRFGQDHATGFNPFSTSYHFKMAYGIERGKLIPRTAAFGLATSSGQRRRSPLDALKDRPKAASFDRVDLFDEAYSAFEVRTKTGMAAAILAGWTEPHTIRQRRLQQIEILPSDIHVPIDDQPREVLPDALTHDPGLAVIHRKTLFKKYGSDM